MSWRSGYANASDSLWVLTGRMRSRAILFVV